MGIDTRERFDVIVVGGGPAGAAAAYRLAQAGVKVLLLERGQYSGAKNMMGGRIYTHSLEALIPDFRERAPLERQVMKERISIAENGHMTTVEYVQSEVPQNEESYVALRSKFDKWLAQEAEKQGALLICNVQVTELLVHQSSVNAKPQVIGVRCDDDEVYADLVIVAEGANTLLLEQAGLCAAPDPHALAVGVKETYKLAKSALEDRCGLMPDQGMAWLTLGDLTAGLMGGGFVYTNKDSVSVGLVVGLDKIGSVETTVEDMLLKFQAYPAVAQLLKGAQLKEHSAHLVPEGGYHSMPRLGGPGYVVVGDAARMCMNLGYTIRGMDLAIGSGMLAADAYLAAMGEGDSSKTASHYRHMVHHSWLGKDLELYRHFPSFLGGTDRIFQVYPQFVNDIMKDVFTINDAGATPIMGKLLHRVEQVGMKELMIDALKGVRAL